MSFRIEHKFKSMVPDKSNRNLLRPSDWNDEHIIINPNVLDLDDTPNSYAGANFNVLRVNAAGDGVEFMTLAQLLSYINLPHVYISTENPQTGEGQDGDIWIKYVV